MKPSRAVPVFNASTLKRLWTVLSMMLLAAACSGPAESERTETRTVRQASVVGESEIQKKWEALGGAAVVGNPLEPLTEIIAGRREFRKFQNGVIVWSIEHGAVFLSTPVFTKWTGLILFNTQSGQNAMEAIGAPARDEKRLSDGEEAWFPNGVIIGKTLPTGEHRIMVVMGAFFQTWGRNRAELGSPIDHERDTGVGGRMQSFQRGDLYMRPGATDVFAIMIGLRDKLWTGFLEPASVGFPVGDTQVVISGVAAIGFTQKFERGDVYLRTGAERPRIVRGDLREGYRKHGGPAGWLGFPISDTETTGPSGSGDAFNDFEGGLLVDHLADDVWKGIVAFKSLTFFLDKGASANSEGGCGSVDIYSEVDITVDGSARPRERVPGTGDLGADGDFKRPFVLKEIANGHTEIKVEVRLWDDDGLFCFGPEDLGAALETYSIHNLYGLLRGDHEYPTHSHEGSGKVTMTMTDTLPYDPSDFRKTQFWSWENYSQAILGDDEFAATFEDVGPDESWVWNPFNRLFYNEVYKKIAENGVCFGMALESIEASYGRSAYGEPIYRYFERFAGMEPPAMPDTTGNNRALIKTINIKQGFQLGGAAIEHILQLYQGDFTTDAYSVRHELWRTGSTDEILSITDNVLFGRGHSVRPFHVSEVVIDPSDCIRPGDQCCSMAEPCQFIDVSDGNHPKLTDTATPTQLEFYPIGNKWRYPLGPNPEAGEWAGTPDQGGRIFLLPYRLFAGPQVTPFQNFGAILEEGIFALFSGDSGSISQISDQQGRTVFEPGLAELPTRWDQLRHDVAGRTPHLFPIPNFAGDGTPSTHFYAGHAKGSTLTFEIERNPANFAQTPYSLLTQSVMFSSLLEVEGTLGAADRITARDIGTPVESMTFAVPPDGEPKEITWTLSGANRTRWKRFTELLVRPNQSITVKVENGGKTLIVDNDGPLTTGVLTVAGMGALEETLGTTFIWPGTNTFDVASPHLTANIEGNGFPWSRTPVTVTLVGRAVSGWSTATIEYSTDGVSWTPYTGPFTYAVEGVSTLHYRARDDQANVTTKSTEIKIDTIRPETVVNVVPNGFSYMVKDFTPGSGFQTFHAVVTNKNGEVTTVDFAYPNGTVPLTTNYSTVEFYSRDVAGNQDGPRSLTNRDYPGLVLSHNPVGYWRLNDPAGSTVAVDLGSGQNNGVGTGGPWPNSPPPSLNHAGAIASDPATSAFVTVSKSTTPGYVPPTQSNWFDVPHAANQVPYDLTLEAWFTHPPGQQQYSVIAGKMSPAQPVMNGGYGIYWWGHQLHFYINSVYERVSAPIAPSATNWRHVVGTYNRSAGIMTIYLDGVAMASLPRSNPINVAAVPFRIGKGPYLGWVGYIDEVALYDRALTADDVLQHYQRGRQSAQ